MNESEAVLLTLFLAELEGHPVIITAPIADLLTWCSYDTCKIGLKTLVQYGFIENCENKQGYYSLTQKGRIKLYALKDDSDMKYLNRLKPNGERWRSY
ncbi:putative transcriptional regulator [Methanococcus maripaludis]|uniref:Putative transcriptional regulator n=1 Tax=Methanococcus maripaludis TaxID=39152 RepID=A0A7J9NX02_METMI|nr:hypothetical protein [Methanococcus maripaludis]MBA2851543.1 putative transcriptional regulator [Methanococcus maripaludis]